MTRPEIKTLFVSLLFLGCCVLVFIPFMGYHEHRAESLDIVFQDPMFTVLPALDLSLLIFITLYGSIILYCVLNYKENNFIAIVVVCYGFLVLLRMISMSSIPLNHPDSIIYLNDPFLNNLIYPGRIYNDLFFSGHAALFVILYFVSKVRWPFLILGICMSFFVMIQRVHYSIDVLGAIPFGILATILAKKAIHKWSFKNNS